MLEWRKVEGFEYEVSNTGLVRSLKTNNVLSARVSRYATVTLCSDGIQKQVTIHRLAAEAFLPNPLNLPMINHKDENKLNNNVDNLEWCDAVYNAAYSFGKPVLQLINGEVFAEHASVNDAARAVNGKACQMMRRVPLTAKHAKLVDAATKSRVVTSIEVLSGLSRRHRYE